MRANDEGPFGFAGRAFLFYGVGMVENKPEFGATPSRPRAGRGGRLCVYLVLLLVALAAIWFIDRGANVLSPHPAPATSAGKT